MMSLKYFNYQQLIQQVLIGFSISFCLASLAEATDANSISGNASPNFQNSHRIEIAQETNVCDKSGGVPFVSAETKSFFIYICGGDNPHDYVGIAKNGGNAITLPLKSISKDGRTFVAVNGNTSYTLTKNQLIVKQNERVILRERATWRW